MEAHEVVLEVEPAVVRADPRAHRLVTHGQDPAGHPQRGLEREADGRQALPGAQPLGPQNVRREIPVAEPEPGRGSVALEHRRADEGVACQPPALLAIREAGQRVQDRVVVGHHQEAVQFEVVAGVDEHRQLARGQRLLQAVGQLGTADAAGQGHDAHGRALSRPGPCPPRRSARSSRDRTGRGGAR